MEERFFFLNYSDYVSTRAPYPLIIINNQPVRITYFYTYPNR